MPRSYTRKTSRGQRDDSRAIRSPGQRADSRAIRSPGQRADSRAIRSPGQRADSRAIRSPAQRDDSRAIRSPGQRADSRAIRSPGQRADSRAIRSPGQRDDSRAIRSPGQRDDSRAIRSPGQRADSRAIRSPGQRDDSRAIRSPAQRDDSRAIRSPGQRDDSRHYLGDPPVRYTATTSGKSAGNLCWCQKTDHPGGLDGQTVCLWDQRLQPFGQCVRDDPAEADLAVSNVRCMVHQDSTTPHPADKIANCTLAGRQSQKRGTTFGLCASAPVVIDATKELMARRRQALRTHGHGSPVYKDLNRAVRSAIRSDTCSEVRRRITAISEEELSDASAADECLSVVRGYVSGQWPRQRDVDPRAAGFFQVRDELSVHGQLLLRGDRLVVPAALRERVLTNAHAGHQGVVRTKQRLRERFWWPRLDRQVRDLLKSCEVCSQHDGHVRRERPPLQPIPLPDGPWQRLMVDVIGPMRGPSSERYGIVLVDMYSRWPEVALCQDATADSICQFLETVFAREAVTAAPVGRQTAAAGRPALHVLTHHPSPAAHAVCHLTTSHRL
ncbi:uncharacterized protein FJT64_011181 [Amphibalanus amphitrite]|uniref:RNA-directed DNA polymerase n=1 Tax=Amphibalanus amphitrite TaxID=1232801 RepID=A0A6A4VMX5_AMPAM|nr:uncharacterized protein FJT64_011181 [Amphibalanus amphitrite]